MYMHTYVHMYVRGLPPLVKALAGAGLRGRPCLGLHHQHAPLDAEAACQHHALLPPGGSLARPRCGGEGGGGRGADTLATYVFTYYVVAL